MADRGTAEWTGGKVDGLTDRRVGERTDRQMEGWVHGWKGR